MASYAKMIAAGKRWDKLFILVGLSSMLVGLITLSALIIDLAIDGVPRLSLNFFTSFPSRFPEEAGILSAWVGTSLVMLVTALSAVPLGIAAGIYLEEYSRKNWLTDFIEINIANLAGVPSIIYGLMALGLFVYQLHLGQSILTAGLTLALLILPMVIMATREAIRSVPTAMREAAYAVGSNKWEVVKDHVLPYSTGGILTGVIIGLSRAIGETAPLITIGALTFIAFLPKSLMDPFTVMPIQMFNWVSRPQEAFHFNAAAAGLVLMAMTLAMNGLAFYIRFRFRKKIKW
ncbi:MAG: phosphate ABC transporter, permease protein PstA [Deltaproteobacteria bacterium RIFCSPLOWO2_01_44_7]|nr:MAG: phosphate ABC transporter, permease protein PstA [Deltaproteobacteria bacterium RIFCSPHIGHO2_01_FULL_43_49]OGQ14708.1 MAG: phosphate ABC transporter, permease protein PstA [Deltaproteobacteria bacterium RIFCSPHIGHO2_02_FULL_44_53]OGQ28094.1 MAG: phosphate ABC transporter, permease protein PstA [Deltaproteobacteria bacterium RIFCSPHIGHO2_12_FULL_44_21]OGQ31306.1 MAG: phosphate ABC transporter, permease protein PstA [Deltaproteobacteria bacterium RIFCSPLOWO2_01_FULL_45_74]OGQ38869.1 MAG: 